MAALEKLENDLRKMIADKEVVLVVGTGVSVSATKNAPASSWKGLLSSGVDWCRNIDPSLSARWAQRRKEDIEEGEIAEMIAAAELIGTKLGAPSSGEFARWLEDEVGGLKIKDRSVLDALIELDLQVTTTNYDHLIEQATELPAASWKETRKVERILRGREKDVLHLHGSWDQPESVVLGIKSYEAVKASEHAQAVLKSLRMTKSLLFVGCGDGLSDPNFGNFLTWTRSVFAESSFRQFCLVRESERERLQKQHPPEERLFFLSYGSEYADLGPFLKTLGPKKSARGKVAAGAPEGASTRIFISYRRDDSAGYAGRLCKELCARFGEPNVFMDIGKIQPGEKFVSAIETAVDSCDTMLVLIAKQWLAISDEHGNRRLDSADDTVRFEIEAGLERGLRVIPILLQGAAMPKEKQLPSRIGKLAEHNAGELSDKRWDFDFGELIKSISVPFKKPDVKPETLSPALSAYQDRLAEETRWLRLIGLGESLQIDLEIKDAYVPLRTAVTRVMAGKFPGRSSDQVLREMAHTEENSSLCEMFEVSKGYRKRGVVLLGEPGAGKTTGARQLCWLLAAGEQSPEDLGLPQGLIPVFLRLRNLLESDAENGLKDFVVRETLDKDAPDSEANPGPELWNRAPVLWVFDGLDEVVSERTRGKVCRRIQDFLRNRKRDHVLVTSRYQGYGQAVDLGPSFVQFHVQPLKQDQVDVFVERWFQAAYKELYGDKPKAEKEAETDSANLKGILNQTDYTIGGLRELRTNPLLLTVVCLVYHQEHSLPRGRSALYDKCVTVFLESWRKGLYDGGRVQPYEPLAAQRVLARLAWWMHCQGEKDSGRKSDSSDERRGSPSAGIEPMAEAVSKPLSETPEGAGLGRDGKRFIERMRDESGILVNASPGCCSFLHLTFQEYLAATHAVEEGFAGELVQRLGKSWWREVILLALARANGPFAKAFFAAFLESPVWEADLNFAARCLDEAAVTILDPFLDRLKNRKTPNSQKIRILQLLRHQDDAALVEACQNLAKDPDPEISTLAREILQRSKKFKDVEIVEKERPEAPESVETDEVHVDLRTGIAFVAVPGGEFDMGSDHQSREQPIHKVRISAFRLGRYPVTNQEYERFLKAAESKNPPTYWDDKRFNQPQQPVVGVSWDDCQAFCEWAGCRFPTEAEWEYACRAGTTSVFHYGDSLSSKQANFDGNYPYGKAKKGPYVEKTTPVGSYEPNAYGLYDMHGNVLEWCQDWYEAGYYKQSSEANPQGPKKGENRVLRGGGWCNFGELCRSAFRYGYLPSGRYLHFGFRVVLSPRSVP